jgi:hypothetical protein
MLRIALHPAFDHRGRRLYGRFVASIAGRQLCVSRTPLCDSARVLLAEGVDPKTSIATRRAGADFDAPISTVGRAAKLTVRENEKGGPRFAHWEPFPTRRVDAPVRLNQPQVPDTGQTPSASTREPSP